MIFPLKLLVPSPKHNIINSKRPQLITFSIGQLLLNGLAEVVTREGRTLNMDG